MSEQYVLYQYDSCPFCYRVKAFLAQAGIEIPMKDTMFDRDAYVELFRGGGSGQVPCLRIEREGEAVEWLYESGDIIEYLAGRAGSSTAS